MVKNIFSKIQYKIALIVFFAVFFASAINTLYGLNSASKLLSDGAKTKLKSNVYTQAKQLETKLQVISDDLNFLIQVPSLQGIYRALANDGIDPKDGETSTDVWIEQMDTILQKFLEARPGFAEIRLIDSDGFELTKARRIKDQISSPSDRADTTEHIFYQSSIQLKPGETHVTPIVLKRDEDDEIMQPIQPIFYYSAPVYNGQDTIQGLIVIDISAQKYFQSLRTVTHSDEGQQNFLINPKGQYLVHSDNNLMWNALVNKHPLQVFESFPQLQKSSLKETSFSFLNSYNNLIYAHAHIYPIANQKNFYWILGQSSPNLSAQQTIQKTRLISLFILLCSLLITVIISIKLIRHFVSQPLMKTANVLQQVSQRNLKEKVDIETDDEVGHMASALNQAIDSMNQAIQTIYKKSEELINASQQQTTLSKEVSDVMSSVSAGTEEMKTSIQHVSHSASAVANIAKESVSMVELINQRIGNLDKSSSNITKVLHLINKIAEQTNMLALNATIESARAGEAGKGFAVVASEVKSLANNTTEAIDGIQHQVLNVQSEIHEIIAFMKEVYEIIKNIDDYQSSIAVSVEEQAATSNEMARSIANAASNTQDIHEYAANDLLNMANELQELVKRFELQIK